MVKKVIFTVLLMAFFCLAGGAAFAASFTASVDRNEVGVGESLTLDLRLEGTSPQGHPDFDLLRQNFTIYSQGQSSQTSIVNNKMSSSIDWQLTLIPTQAGKITIPAITLKTDAGTMQSQPITVNVTRTATNTQDANNRVVFVQTELSKADPYQNEPVVFTVKLVARRSIANIQLPEFSVDGAIVESQGKPRVYDGIVQGQRVKVVEVKYLVTPLKSGPVKIPPYAFQGQVEASRQSVMPDPFGMMNDMFPGFTGFRAFAASSEGTMLNVKPPATKMDPWLPLTGLELADHIEGLDKARVGEPLTRTLTMAATGTVGASLPNLEDKAASPDDFKIYADKPDTGDNVGDDGIVTGWREERYTLIPQHEGTLTLPAIRVPWWNVKTDKVEYATVPARTITVKPVANAAPAGTVRITPDNTAAATAAGAPARQVGGEGQASGAAPLPTARQAPVAGQKINRLLYVVIGLLGAGIVVLAGAVVYLFRQLGAATEPPKRPQASPAREAANQDRLLPKDLKNIQTPEALRAFIQSFACQHWAVPRNASLPVIVEALESLPGDLPDAQTRETLLALDAALYGGGAVDLDRAKMLVGGLLKKTGTKPLAPLRPAQKRRKLNPS